MKVILFGATGMVGQGVLRECLNTIHVTRILTVGRTPTQIRSPKLKELIHSDLENLRTFTPEFEGFDACFFCLGTPSAGKTEADYERLTYTLTLAVAKLLVELNPQMTFVYVSGIGADSTEQGKVMWARIRGKTENALLRLPFKAVYIFRPGFIQPLHGIRSKTRLYRFFYSLLKPILPILRFFLPTKIATTQSIGLAMIRVVIDGAEKRILYSEDFQRLSQFDVDSHTQPR